MPSIFTSHVTCQLFSPLLNSSAKVTFRFLLRSTMDKILFSKHQDTNTVQIWMSLNPLDRHIMAETETPSLEYNKAERPSIL